MVVGLRPRIIGRPERNISDVHDGVGGVAPRCLQWPSPRLRVQLRFQVVVEAVLEDAAVDVVVLVDRTDRGHCVNREEVVLEAVGGVPEFLQGEVVQRRRPGAYGRVVDVGADYHPPRGHLLEGGRAHRHAEGVLPIHQLVRPDSSVNVVPDESRVLRNRVYYRESHLVR